MKSGIYKIVCLANNKVYIGSRYNLSEAKHTHFKLLNNNDHYNIHLQNAYNKYGLRNFEIHIIEYCEIEKLIEREQFYLDQIPKDMRFNIREKCESNAGLKHSEKAKQKIIQNKLGKPLSQEHKEKLSKIRIGLKHSEETKNKMSIAQSGENNHFYGKHHTTESKEKMRVNSIGKKHSEKTKKKIGDKSRGRVFTKEHKEKLSISNSGENSSSAKFTTQDVIEIRRLYEQEKMKICDIARKYSAKPGNIFKIVHYQRWKDVK